MQHCLSLISVQRQINSAYWAGIQQRIKKEKTCLVFDIVSEIDKVELKNAVDNTEREIGNRFDFRGVLAEVSLKELTVTLKSESDFQVKQLLEVLRSQCTKRGITLAGAEIDDESTHSGKTLV